MSKPVRFDDRVVIVTGAGNGLGRLYALWFAERGAKVVVNDLGGGVSGSGAGKAAQIVVDEIKAKGGQATPNFDSVEFGEKIVQTAMDAYGRVDVVINNAGILRDVSMTKMTENDWDLIMKVHLKGTFSVTRAAWNIMRKQNFGRIINTSSGAGIYGNFGQANYSAAKLGIHGFTQTCAKEGEKRNIFSNTIAPVAASRMTETILPKEVQPNFAPEYIVPLVGYLASEDCQENGSLLEVAGGYIAKHRKQRSQGHMFDLPYSVEDVRTNWENVVSFDRENDVPESLMDTMSKVAANQDRINENKEKQQQQQKAAPAASGPELKSDKIFDLIKMYLDKGEGKALTKSVNAVYQFDILGKKGGPVLKSFTIDVSANAGNGSCSQGKPAKYDSLFTMVDGDFYNVCTGKLNPQNAFMTGKMKIKGNMAKATKFTPELFPAPTPENMAKYGIAKL